MYAFSCQRCGQLVFFANTSCVRCESPLAVDPASLDMVVLDDPSHRCANAAIAGCNWRVAEPGSLCLSCRLTRTRPADDDPGALAAFATAEAAKRRLVFQLLTLGLTLEPRDEETGTGVAFDLLSSVHEPVTTGHAGGVITLDLAESDDVHREMVRQKLREPYRTVLGHFRHEIGHYYFPVLVHDDDLPRARELFGDETIDYQDALDRHYEHGAPSGWEQEHISEYATMHPAEDWAETFAHYLHVRGVLQTAAAYRVHVDGPVTAPPRDAVGRAADDLAPRSSDPRHLDDSSMHEIVETWLPLSYALNAINRSMGADDLYPFVLRPRVIDKLAFVHDVVRRAAGAPSGEISD